MKTRLALSTLLMVALLGGGIALAPPSSAAVNGCQGSQERVWSTTLRESRLKINACIRVEPDGRITTYAVVRKEKVFHLRFIRVGFIPVPALYTRPPIQFDDLHVDLRLKDDTSGMEWTASQNLTNLFGRGGRIDVFETGWIAGLWQKPRLDLSHHYSVEAHLWAQVCDDGKGWLDITARNS